MSSDPDLILEVIPPGEGIALDLGGGTGLLRQPLRARGYRYINLDLRPAAHGEPTVIGDAHALPVGDGTLSLVVAKETLEHFSDPSLVLEEVWRVLRPGGRLVIFVPFLHPFHGDDFYRYSPLGLRHLLRRFDIERLDAPLWFFTLLGLAAAEGLQRLGVGGIERPIRRASRWLDERFARRGGSPPALAAAYRVVAHKPGGI